MKKQITKLNIEDKVIFLGNRNDTYNLLNALDIFVFPSIYEGIPLALIEAQCNGLPIIASDIISKEVKITDCLFFYSLEKKEEEWADFIYKHKDNKRIDTLKEVSKSNYSIEKAIDILKKYYK